MKRIKSKDFDNVYFLQPETPLESVDMLQTFFEADMWYAKGAEWKTEKEMLEYLKTHFEICKKEIKNMESGEVGKVSREKLQKKEKNKESNHT